MTSALTTHGTSPRIVILGTGTCRIDPSRGQTSACIVDGATTFVFDLGFGSLERLGKVGALDNCSDLHIHISHRHTDHLIGIFPLLQCLTWSDDYRHRRISRVVIHATEEVCELVDSGRVLFGNEETNLSNANSQSSVRTVEYRSGPNYGNWEYSVGSLQIASIHLPGSNNHGALCKVDGKRIGFTGDATEMNQDLIDFCSQSDLCVFDFGHLANVQGGDGAYKIDLEPIVTLLAEANPPQARAAHVYLRHLQDRPLNELERESEMARLIEETAERAKRRGFTGHLSLAFDGEHI